MTAATFLTSFAQSFAPEPFNRLARETGWQQRSGKIVPFEFVAGLTFAQLSALRLSLSAQGQNLSEPVTPQALQQRYNEAAVAFMAAAYAHGLRESLAQPPPAAWAEALRAHFKAIVLFDSTAADLPPSLAALYPGCGGSASPANVKMLLRFEWLQSQFEPLALGPGKDSDQGQAGVVAAALRAGELGLMDKGYFSLAALRTIAQRQAFFLTPLPRSVQPWLAAPDGAYQRLDVAEALRTATTATVEWSQVWLGAGGAAGVPVRLVAFRLSEESADRRRAALREAQRRQGRTPTAAALEWAGWQLLVTNAPAEQLPTAAMGYLYRVRWQIELVFRTVKSVLRLDQTEGKNSPRVRCELWARLLAALVVFLWHGHVQAAAWRQGRWEISFEKLARHLQQHGLSLAQALVAGGRWLAQYLHQLWRQLLVGARKGRRKGRKTTWQTLQAYWLELPSG